MLDLESCIDTYVQKHIADQIKPLVQKEQKEEEEQIEYSSGKKKRERKTVSRGKATQRIRRERGTRSMTRSTPRSDSQERQARFFARA